ncbi:hypothetical protein NE237_002314 [Protea cynaroides]|uniref:Uncharacterized protein n=1 Tax=Protea cynaroides TaxID=273540 RepID=A0A9Q0KUT7_9MAGN|nr:hypothetical protein NE237_002314 [Protea cynaroides]
MTYAFLRLRLFTLNGNSSSVLREQKTPKKPLFLAEVFLLPGVVLHCHEGRALVCSAPLSRTKKEETEHPGPPPYLAQFRTREQQIWDLFVVGSVLKQYTNR